MVHPVPSKDHVQCRLNIWTWGDRGSSQIISIVAIQRPFMFALVSPDIRIVLHNELLLEASPVAVLTSWPKTKFIQIHRQFLRISWSISQPHFNINHIRWIRAAHKKPPSSGPQGQVAWCILIEWHYYYYCDCVFTCYLAVTVVQRVVCTSPLLNPWDLDH